AALCGFVPLVSFRPGAMGGGDAKLVAALGASVGIQHGLEIQCVSVALAAMYGLALLAFRGQLLSALGGIVLRPVLLLVCPQRLPARRAVAPLSLRLGVPILVATVLVLAAHGSVPDHIL
ncbi:MAG: prepilin peptidase, partial [Proteobacteria bacterium]|nr:prepilin peptidase [Pseudomonadota bacterium]